MSLKSVVKIIGVWFSLVLSLYAVLFMATSVEVAQSPIPSLPQWIRYRLEISSPSGFAMGVGILAASVLSLWLLAKFEK